MLAFFFFFLQNEYVQETSIKRNSGIELLKIIAILLIVISHTTQTISSNNEYIKHLDYIFTISKASTDIRIFILSIFQHFGALGNNLFFMCSAWFLLDKKTNNKKKWMIMLLDIWIISIIFVIITYLDQNISVSLKMILKSLAPTYFSNNWYMTCYLIFYLLYPTLNKIIESFNKKILFRFCFVMTIMYVFANFVSGSKLEYTSLILWITIYFDMAYIKTYCPDICENIKLNAILLIVSIALGILLSLFTNILGLNISFFSNKLTRWASNCSPILILIAFSSFNLFKHFNIHNKAINYFASLSMFAYLIHENLLFRTYYRPMMIDYVYHMFGYDQIIIIDLVFALLLFMVTLIISSIYEKTIHKLVIRFIDYIYDRIKSFYLRLENKLIN